MDLPAFCEFSINDRFINFFNRKFELYKQKSFLVEYNSNATKEGKQTKNILNLNETDVNEKLNFFKKKLEKKCQCQFEYHWVHLIEYERGGYQTNHKHDHNEDFSVIIYLNTTNDGETYFLLNEKRNIIKEVTPQKGKCIMFLSSINHGARQSMKCKKVLVLGLKIK